MLTPHFLKSIFLSLGKWKKGFQYYCVLKHTIFKMEFLKRGLRLSLGFAVPALGCKSASFQIQWVQSGLSQGLFQKSVGAIAPIAPL